MVTLTFVSSTSRRNRFVAAVQITGLAHPVNHVLWATQTRRVMLPCLALVRLTLLSSLAVFPDSSQLVREVVYNRARLGH